MICVCPGGIRAASKGRSPHCFHQERAYPDGIPKTQEDECSGYQGSHPGSVAQQGFDSDEVDHDMHERLMRAVADGEMDIHDMWQEGDGEQDVRFFKRKVEVVLRELIADERLEGCQHYAFKEYKNANGDRILGGHANGSVSFQLAQARVGPGKVPISIVLYIDATFLKRGIPIRPIYCKLLYDITCDIYIK